MSTQKIDIYISVFYYRYIDLTLFERLSINSKAVKALKRFVDLLVLPH